MKDHVHICWIIRWETRLPPLPPFLWNCTRRRRVEDGDRNTPVTVAKKRERDSETWHAATNHRHMARRLIGENIRQRQERAHCKCTNSRILSLQDIAKQKLSNNKIDLRDCLRRSCRNSTNLSAGKWPHRHESSRNCQHDNKGATAQFDHENESTVGAKCLLSGYPEADYWTTNIPFATCGRSYIWSMGANPIIASSGLLAPTDSR